ncbi:MAG: hypothetical protein ACOCZP_00435, partial [Candidatus Hadarchaeota archaeon]
GIWKALSKRSNHITECPYLGNGVDPSGYKYPPAMKDCLLLVWGHYVDLNMPGYRESLGPR